MTWRKNYFSGRNYLFSRSRFLLCSNSISAHISMMSRCCVNSSLLCAGGVFEGAYPCPPLVDHLQLAIRLTAMGGGGAQVRLKVHKPHHYFLHRYIQNHSRHMQRLNPGETGFRLLCPLPRLYKASAKHGSTQHLG